MSRRTGYIDCSFWEGLFRYDIHIMSEQPPPTEYGWDRYFLVYKMFLGIWETEVMDSITHPYKRIIIKAKEKCNI